MKLVTLNRAVEFDGVNMPAGAPQVWSDGFVQAFEMQIPQVLARVESLNGVYRRYQGQQLHGKNLLLWRTGGFGDLLFMTPLIRELARLYPSCEITVACRPKYHLVFRNNPYVHKLMPLPVSLKTLSEHDYHLHFEGTIEKSTNPKLHAVDLFSKHAGVKISNNNLQFALSPEDIERGHRILLKCDPDYQHRHIAIQVRSSSPVRTYPWRQLQNVIHGLVRRGCQVYLLGSIVDRPEISLPGVFNFCGAFPEMTDTVALLSQCDLLIAPDSSLVHFAGAMNIPTIALYGPFPGAVRTKYYPRCTTLEPDYPCIPCFTHGHQPCPKARQLNQVDSPCFQHLTPECILGEVYKLFSPKGGNRMLRLKNCLFQPLTLHLKDSGETVHLLARGTATIQDAQLSDEIKRAERKGFLKITRKAEQPPPTKQPKKRGRRRK